MKNLRKRGLAVVLAGVVSSLFAEAPLKVTVFGDDGPSGMSAHEWYRILNDSPDVDVSVVSGYTVRNTDILDHTDIFVVPGGESAAIPNSLMYSGMNKLRDWIRNGGKYYGTCCGCALLLQQDYYLAIAPFRRLGSVSTAYGGNYGINISAEAAEALGMTPGYHAYRYAQGPIMEATAPVEFSTIECWGTFCSEGQYRSACDGVSANQYGAVALIAGGYGSGKVFATAQHPESFRSTYELIVAGFRWLTGREVRFPKRFKQPGAIRVALSCGSDYTYLYKTAPLTLAIDNDDAFRLVTVDATGLSGGTYEHVDAVVLADGPSYSSLYNPKSSHYSAAQQFIAGGGKFFGYGTSAADAAHYGESGVVGDSAEDIYRLLRETYAVTSDPSIHLHEWTYVTNSVRSCTTPEEIVKTCHTDGCPTPVVTNTAAALGHDFGEWVTVTAPTEEMRGVARRSCRRQGCDACEEKTLPKIDETYYKIGVDPYNYSSFTKSYNATYGWAETPDGTVDPDHIVDPEVNYVVPVGTRLRTPFSGKTCTFAGKSLSLGGTIALNDTAGNQTKTIDFGSVSIVSTTAVITVGNSTPIWTIRGSVSVPEGKHLKLNMYAESVSHYAIILESALSGPGDVSVNGSSTAAPSYSFLTLANAADYTGVLSANDSRDMHFSLNVTGGFGGSLRSLPVGTTNVVFNYDGLDAKKGVLVSTNVVPVALKTHLKLYSSTADFNADRLVLMTFPAGTVVDEEEFTVKHATSKNGAGTAFERLKALTAPDGSVQLVANYCNHQWGAWSAGNEPTFLEEGSREHTCSVCSLTEHETTGKLTVPAGYRAAEYVESDGNQFIDTGIAIQDNITSDLTFEWTKRGTYHMLGAWDKSNGNMREYLVNTGSSYKWRAALANTSPSELNSIPAAVTSAVYHVVSSVSNDTETVIVNGVSQTMVFPDPVAARPRCHFLFAYNEEGSALSKSYAKLYQAKIYTNSTVLARQYLPVYKESTGKFGLWDTVAGTFQESAFTKDFLGKIARRGMVMLLE